jgi:hypothetical protein
MRILVTGPLNPTGKAVVEALAGAGHVVRAFGIPPGEDPFQDPNVEVFPGEIGLNGSVEPVAAECQAIVHCAPLDKPGKDRMAFAGHVEKGTLYARYAAERELVSAFIALFPAEPARGWGKAMDQAKAHVQATRKVVPQKVLTVVDTDAAVRGVLAALPAEVPPPAVTS